MPRFVWTIMASTLLSAAAFPVRHHRHAPSRGRVTVRASPITPALSDTVYVWVWVRVRVCVCVRVLARERVRMRVPRCERV